MSACDYAVPCRVCRVVDGDDRPADGCLRQTPEAIANRARRRTLSVRGPDRWPSIFDRICAKRGKRGRGASDSESYSSLLKFVYPMTEWEGPTYRHMQTYREAKNFVLRRHRLRGGAYPSVDDAADMVSGLKRGGGIKALMYEESPWFSLLKKGAA